MHCYVALGILNVAYEDMFIIIIACWPVTRYVISLFVFNTVCYGYLRLNFHGFRRFLIHVWLYTQCLRYNICSAWFLDIRISTCILELLLCVTKYIICQLFQLYGVTSYMPTVFTSLSTVYWESFTEENIQKFCGFWNDHECFLATIFYL